MVMYEQPYDSKRVDVPLLAGHDLDSIILILHTLGSTNFPKPVCPSVSPIATCSSGGVNLCRARLYGRSDRKSPSASFPFHVNYMIPHVHIELRPLLNTDHLTHCSPATHSIPTYLGTYLTKMHDRFWWSRLVDLVNTYYTLINKMTLLW